MKPLFTCAACGFLSTRGDQFKRVKGVRFDLDCIDDYLVDREPVASWVKEKIAAASSNNAVAGNATSAPSSSDSRS